MVRTSVDDDAAGLGNDDPPWGSERITSSSPASARTANRPTALIVVDA